MSKRFNVALSFPGEHRQFVHQVAEVLGNALGRERVFYDEWYETELLGTAGDLKLLKMYDDSDLVVPFFSKYYEKPWCSLEWETIRGILLMRRSEDAVIPVHLDNTKISGWPIVSFGIELRGRDASGVAGVILKSLYLRVEKSERKIGKEELTVTAVLILSILGNASWSTFKIKRLVVPIQTRNSQSKKRSRKQSSRFASCPQTPRRLTGIARAGEPSR